MSSTITPTTRTSAIQIPISRNIHLDGDLVIPPDARGVVLFAHGSGSSRHSSRNRFVAAELNSIGMATLLADLLTAEEEELDLRGAAYRFDIPGLTRRLVQLIDWAHAYEPLVGLPAGLFGASTGAAAALDAAAARPDVIAAVVSRGGRPDLAVHLSEVKSPTLLIVGGNDVPVLHMNNEALLRLSCIKELQVIPGATHLFEERGKLDAVAAAAGAWFEKYLSAGKGDTP